jgi:methylenetetrahydrofolate dehydrogenase (NADP+)/methenyltetrahydrofolate cyclohydrolase
MLILDGKKARDSYTERLKERILDIGFSPTLAIIQVGKNEESSAYIRQKKRFGDVVGAKTEHISFPENVSFAEIEEKISELNDKEKIDGIIIQLPLPAHLDKMALIRLISPEKDVDGLTENSKFIPATARGVKSLLDFYDIPVKGKKVAMLGRSMLVGAPTARLMTDSGAHVIICHSHTANTRDITKSSDIIIVAIGKPRLIDDTYIGENEPVVVDIGINSVKGDKLEEEIGGRTLVGDVDFDKVAPLVSAISPVPGGVGPMTVLSLFENLVDAADKHYNEDRDLNP